MLVSDFFELMQKMEAEEQETMIGKGQEYTIGSTDKLANFKRVAERTGLRPEQVLMVYFLKHIDSICNYIKDGKVYSNESIEGRIMDARNYLALLRAMIQESQSEQGIKK